jgi:adenosylcobyric acid synthase
MELKAAVDVLVIEGAGSPAEINLQPTDIVNMRVAEAADAATLLICDIDRGGAFAHLFGTFHLLPAQQRALIRGFVLNKFRGDARLLAPAPEKLESLTGVPTLGVLPMWHGHGLPEEDAVFDASPSSTARGGTTQSIAIVAYPYISNLDEFAPLANIPGVSLNWARRAASIGAADVLILPGSKHVAADLDWLRKHGLEQPIRAHLAADKSTLAICGGLQMLGREIDDPFAVEAAATGLGAMPWRTEFRRAKQYRNGKYTLGRLQGAWSALSGRSFDGYEIHHGETRVAADASQMRRPPTPVLPDNAGWQQGQTLAIYPHGLFESGAIVRSLFGETTPTLDDRLEGLADFIERHLGERTLLRLIA